MPSKKASKASAEVFPAKAKPKQMLPHFVRPDKVGRNEIEDDVSGSLSVHRNESVFGQEPMQKPMYTRVW